MDGQAWVHGVLGPDLASEPVALCCRGSDGEETDHAPDGEDGLQGLLRFLIHRERESSETFGNKLIFTTYLNLENW